MVIVFVIIYGIVSDAILAATIASSFAPIAVDIKLQEERDMDTKSLSKLQVSRVSSSEMDSGAVRCDRKVETNLSKRSLFCKVLEEEVHSFQRLLPMVIVFVIIYGIVSDAILGDHVYLSYSRLGAI